MLLLLLMLVLKFVLVPVLLLLLGLERLFVMVRAALVLMLMMVTIQGWPRCWCLVRRLLVLLMLLMISYLLLLLLGLVPMLLSLLLLLLLALFQARLFARILVAIVQLARCHCTGANLRLLLLLLEDCRCWRSYCRPSLFLLGLLRKLRQRLEAQVNQLLLLLLLIVIDCLGGAQLACPAPFHLAIRFIACSRCFGALRSCRRLDTANGLIRPECVGFKCLLLLLLLLLLKISHFVALIESLFWWQLSGVYRLDGRQWILLLCLLRNKRARVEESWGPCKVGCRRQQLARRHRLECSLGQLLVLHWRLLAARWCRWVSLRPRQIVLRA